MSDHDRTPLEIALGKQEMRDQASRRVQEAYSMIHELRRVCLDTEWALAQADPAKHADLISKLRSVTDKAAMFRRPLPPVKIQDGKCASCRGAYGENTEDVDGTCRAPWSKNSGAEIGDDAGCEDWRAR